MDEFLELAEICQTRTFELQTFQSYFEHAVDTGLFQHDLFRRLTNVQINIVSDESGLATRRHRSEPIEERLNCT